MMITICIGMLSFLWGITFFHFLTYKSTLDQYREWSKYEKTLLDVIAMERDVNLILMDELSKKIKENENENE